MSHAKRNREAGHSFERDCVNEFKKCGFGLVQTSRQANRQRDAEKVDLAYSDEVKHGRFPYNVQCKTTATPLSYHKVMDELPIIPGVRNVILHKRTKKQGTKFMTEGRYAFMYSADFFELVSELETAKAELTALKRILDENSPNRCG